MNKLLLKCKFLIKRCELEGFKNDSATFEWFENIYNQACLDEVAVNGLIVSNQKKDIDFEAHYIASIIEKMNDEGLKKEIISLLDQNLEYIRTIKLRFN